MSKKARSLDELSKDIENLAARFVKRQSNKAKQKGKRDPKYNYEAGTISLETRNLQTI